MHNVPYNALLCMFFFFLDGPVDSSFTIEIDLRWIYKWTRSHFAKIGCAKHVILDLGFNVEGQLTTWGLCNNTCAGLPQK